MRQSSNVKGATSAGSGAAPTWQWKRKTRGRNKSFDGTCFNSLQASERAEGHGIPARGLTGRTYEGHYFWDTEIYVLPFLAYTRPWIARSLLKYRYDMLDKARACAQRTGAPRGYLPWRTINGEEASAYYAAGTAQYHINADIAYALRKYVEISGDEDFLPALRG